MSDDRSPKQRREELQKRADSAQESHRNGTLNGTPNGTPRGGPTEVFEGQQDDEQTDENVFLFVPNLIGYLRIVLALASLYFMPLHPRRCSFLYSVSCLLDALDGVAARKFKQSTRFGAVLDMVTDRCTTTCLLVFLATAKPAYSIIFQGLISLDLASHYMHMYATLAMGGQGESHKNVSSSRSWIMNKYYSNKTMLFVCCALNELFFIALYLLCFSSPRITPALLPSAGLDINGTTPTTPHEPTPSLLFPSPFSAAAMEMARANKMDSFVPWVLTLVSLPVMLLKQYINVEQLVKASQWLAEGDRKDRSKAIREGRLKKGERLCPLCPKTEALGKRIAKLAPVREVVGRITIHTISRAFSFALKRPIQTPWISSNERFLSATSALQSTPSDDSQPREPSRTVSQIKDLLNLGGSQAVPNPSREVPATKYSASIEPRVFRYEQRSNPTDQWRRRNVLGTRKDESKLDIEIRHGKAEIVLKDTHQARLLPPYQDFYQNERRFDTVGHRPMRSYVQILTTPTADSPGTTLVLHFDNKRYLIGSLAEGTQRACVQMGARLLKVSECFITGRTEWRNTGGLIGMILTLADAASSSAAASADDAKKRAQAKGKRLGVSHDKEKMKALEEEAKKDVANRKLTLFSGPNLNHTLATARRFVFRKGMPVDVHEIDESLGRREGEDAWAPYWADENIKVWAMSIVPSPVSSAEDSSATKSAGTVSPRKRSIDEFYEREPVPDGGSTVTASSITPKERDLLTVKAVVSEMFNSSWRLDTLYETPLSEVKLPASIFVRNAETNKIERYSGPLPGGKNPVPDPNMTVLVRKPWPGALVESLPPAQPAKEAISYIVRNHTQRGKFQPERAKALKVEKGFKWAQLSAGNSVENEDGETITPDMVLGESKEGGGFAILDVPDESYIEALLARPEWREPKVMAGVGAIVWACGRGVATNDRVRVFMQEHSGIEHIVSSPDYCPNNISLDSAAAATVRLRQVDPWRYVVPDHQNTLSQAAPALPQNVRKAERGQMIQLEPGFEVHSKQAIPPLDIAATEAETSSEILEEAKKSQEAAQQVDEPTQKWIESLPPDADKVQITTLGTGSALPSKYRNVSSTLMRVPGWGSMLFDAGENTLGQLKRAFPVDELKAILKELRLIFISHMHADHHLGTVSVIRAWYEEVHNRQPLPAGALSKENYNVNSNLAVISEPAMSSWLNEYAAVEDYGFSRVAPLYVSPANTNKGTPSKLGWFTPPTELASLPSAEARMEMLAAKAIQPSMLNLTDVQAVAVQHCHGARAASFTFPSGFKASYSGDCRPSKPFTIIGKGSTVCIHEATFDDELQGDAEAKNHSTTSEALGVAQAMGAKACVLTHFSQRYQKLPVMEHGTGNEAEESSAAKALTTEDVPMSTGSEEDESTNPEDDLAGPLEDVAETLPDQQTVNGSARQVDLPSKSTKGGAKNSLDETFDGPRKSGAPPPEAVRFKLTSDMKVCVAFDYMRVRVGEIGQLEKFTPALLKLFAEEEKPEVDGEPAVEEGKGGKKGKEKGGKGKGKKQGK